MPLEPSARLAFLPELVKSGFNAFKKFDALALMPSDRLVLLPRLAGEHTHEELRLRAGKTLREIFDATLAEGCRYIHSKAIKKLRREFLPFVQRYLKETRKDNYLIPDDPEDINALYVTREMCQHFVNKFTPNTGQQMAETAKGIWRRAKGNVSFMVEERAIFANDPWALIEYGELPEFPTCIISPEKILAALIILAREFPIAFLPTLLEATLGARASEACWGLNKAHREHDELIPITPADFHFAKGIGLYDEGYVTMPCNKTMANGLQVRSVSLTPFAAMIWKPIIEKLIACGKENEPICKTHLKVITRYQSLVYKRLGIFDEIASKCRVPVELVGTSCQANKSILRHSFLTYTYFQILQVKKMDMSVVRQEAGHGPRSHILEDHYLTLSDVPTSERFVNLTLPEEFSFDPVEDIKAWHERQKENQRAAATNWPNKVSPEEYKRRTSAMSKGIRQYRTNPEFSERRAQHYKKISETLKQKWPTLPPEERQRRVDSLNKGRIAKLNSRTPEENELIKQKRLAALAEASKRVSPEQARLRAQKGAESRKARIAALPIEEQKAEKEKMRQNMLAARAKLIEKRKLTAERAKLGGLPQQTKTP